MLEVLSSTKYLESLDSHQAETMVDDLQEFVDYFESFPFLDQEVKYSPPIATPRLCSIGDGMTTPNKGSRSSGGFTMSVEKEEEAEEVTGPGIGEERGGGGGGEEDKGRKNARKLTMGETKKMSSEEEEEKKKKRKRMMAKKAGPKTKEGDYNKNVRESGTKTALNTKVGDVLDLIEKSLADPEPAKPTASMGRRASILILTEQDDYTDAFYPGDVDLLAENNDKIEEEQKLIEARQNFFLKLEEATHMAEETLKYINHTSDGHRRRSRRRRSHLLASHASSINLRRRRASGGSCDLDASGGELVKEEDEVDDIDEDDEDDYDDFERRGTSKKKEGPIEFDHYRDRETFRQMSKNVEVLTEKIRVNERTRGIEQVSRWLTNKKMRLINDTKLLGDLEKEAQLVDIEFGSGSRSLHNDINSLADNQMQMLQGFQSRMKKINESSRRATIDRQRIWDQDQQSKSAKKQVRKTILEAELMKVRSELKRVEGKIEDVGAGSSGKLDEVRALNDKYEARTKHLLDIIEQQQTKITKLTSELSRSDTQVMQMELNRREMRMHKQMNNQDGLLRKKMVEAEQKKKKIIHRKMLRQQMEKRILEDAEDEDVDRYDDDDDDEEEGDERDETRNELKKAREVNSKLHNDLQTRLDEIDEIESSIADAIPAEVRVKTLQSTLKAAEKENDKLEYRLRMAEKKIKKINAPKDNDALNKWVFIFFDAQHV